MKFKVLFSICLMLFIQKTIAQEQIIKPKKEIKTIQLSSYDSSNSYINYPSFHKQTENTEPQEQQDNSNSNIDLEAFEYLVEQNKKLLEIVSRDKKANPISEDNSKKTIDFDFPLEDIYITSEYGMRYHPIDKVYKHHNGIDFRARYKKLKSILNGKVIDVGEDKAKGKYIKILSADIEIRYYHLSEIFVGINDFVNAGMYIGRTGNSGKSTAPHLHIETLINNNHIDPSKLLIQLNNLKQL